MDDEQLLTQISVKPCSLGKVFDRWRGDVPTMPASVNGLTARNIAPNRFGSR
jgi:hypothetical protein